MASSKIPTRLIYCVDGTYCTPDGTSRRGHGNISNVYRIYASVKKGLCFDEHTHQEFIQEKYYEEGIGSADDLNFFDKLNAGARGKGYKHMIRRIYQKCFFDTVKALDDAHIYDISFNKSTQNFRHALALNENRRHMKPAYEFPKFGETKIALSKRSFVQAWFVGAHMDMGGSSAKDGLALYPLQRMLGESQSKGLVLEFEQLRAPWSGIDDPLRVVFPEDEYDGKRRYMWTCTTRNGVCVHECVVQASTLSTMPDRGRIEDRKAKMLGTENHVLNQVFWHDEEPPKDDGVKAVRILVCGNTGVGKSTLINEVFGVNVGHQVVGASDRKCGQHDVQEGFCHENRPDLIIHDSEGFEAGDGSQVQAIGQFVRERSKMPRIEDRLHVIWFCMEMNSARTQQTATKDLFKAVSEHTAEVPVIVVATKLDHFRAIMREEAREGEKPSAYEASPQQRVDLDRKYAEYASERIKERTDLIESEFQNFDAGHLDGCVAVARSLSRLVTIDIGALQLTITDDHKSIERLNQITLENVKDEKLQLLYIATQTASINLKINTAIGEVMKIYRRVLASTSTVSCIPTAVTTNRAGAAMAICKAIVQCFGLPTVNYGRILEIVKTTVWGDTGHNALILFSEAVTAVAMMFTVATAGLPVFLAAGAFNFPMVVPATTRLMLMIASDLILVLVRAFRSTTTTCVGQPEEEHVIQAARDYRHIRGNVHEEVLRLVPKKNVMKSFRYGKVRLGLENVIRRYQEEVTADSIEDRFSRAGLKSFVSDRVLNDEIEAATELVPKSKAELHDREAEIREVAARPMLESPESTDDSDDESIH
ncbi:MAG: hypothetical protein Q9194_006392 [Teloschistes cf. exilis]